MPSTVWGNSQRNSLKEQIPEGGGEAWRWDGGKQQNKQTNEQR